MTVVEAGCSVHFIRRSANESPCLWMCVLTKFPAVIPWPNFKVDIKRTEWKMSTGGSTQTCDKELQKKALFILTAEMTADWKWIKIVFEIIVMVSHGLKWACAVFHMLLNLCNKVTYRMARIYLYLTFCKNRTSIRQNADMQPRKQDKLK